MTSSEYDNKWFMVTVVLREITPENDVLNKFKTSCKIYLNGIKMLDREVEAPYNGIEDQLEGSAAMKHNNSPLHLNPGDILYVTILIILLIYLVVNQIRLYKWRI